MVKATKRRARGIPLSVRGSSDRIEVHGPLTFATANAALELLRRAINSAAAAPEVNLAGVTACDSAGVALLVECVNLARRQRLNIRFTGASDQALTIAGACGLMPLLFPTVQPTGM